MSEYDTDGHESTDLELDERDVRALTQYLTVLDDTGRARDAPGLYLVVSESGSEYLVDAVEGVCECPDHRHRDVRCKHLRRVAFATGERPIPADVDGIDEQLGMHVDATPQRAAADGGIIDAGDDGEILDERDGPDWVGPFPEVDRYGEPTGERFVRCPACGVEVLAGEEHHATHRPACRFE